MISLFSQMCVPPPMVRRSCFWRPWAPKHTLPSWYSPGHVLLAFQVAQGLSPAQQMPVTQKSFDPV